MARQKKELGLDSMGIQKTMRFKDYFGDGIGQLPLGTRSLFLSGLFLYVCLLCRREKRPGDRRAESLFAHGSL